MRTPWATASTPWPSYRWVRAATSSTRRPAGGGHDPQAAVVAGDGGGAEAGHLVGGQVEQHLAQVVAGLAPAGAEDDGGVDRRPVARSRLGGGEVGDDGREPLADDGRRRGRGVLPGALLGGLHGSRH